MKFEFPIAPVESEGANPALVWPLQLRLTEGASCRGAERGARPGHMAAAQASCSRLPTTTRIARRRGDSRVLARAKAISDGDASGLDRDDVAPCDLVAALARDQALDREHAEALDDSAAA